MAELTNTFTSDIGMVSHGLAGSEMSPEGFDSGTTYVWILSSTAAQTTTKRGKWIDGSTWVDANKWYD